MRADNLFLTRNGRWVLDDVSLTLEPGTITVLLGPNGAGKSTLMSCLAGLTEPESGAVSIGSQPINAMPARERARQIGLLPQDADIHWDIGVRALVELGRLPHQGRWGANPGDEAIVLGAMRQTDCLELAGRRARQLSGGEQARVLLARVLAGQPQWLLADEPLANLDAAHQLDALACLRTVADSGIGVALVLHDLTQAARIADKVVVMDEGRVVAAGPPADVLTQDLLARVFSIRVHVGGDAATGTILTPVARIGP